MGCAQSNAASPVVSSLPNGHSKPVTDNAQAGGIMAVGGQPEGRSFTARLSKKFSRSLSKKEGRGAETNGGSFANRTLPGSTEPEGVHDVKKQRRLGLGNEVVRGEIRRIALGASQAGDEQSVLQVSDSDTDDQDESGFLESPSGRNMRADSKPTEVTEFLMDVMGRGLAFQGISGALLRKVVDRMYGVSFRSGATILEQGAVPGASDCLYVLEKGNVDVVIHGGGAVVDSNGGEGCMMVDNTRIVHQYPGWLFGDVALLFNTPRSASVVAATNCTLWAMDRPFFMKFVMKHAQGARTLRFVRKLPLLKGLSDNALISVAERMREQTYEDGEHLIHYGRSGNELYLIRYGKVAVVVPTGSGGHHVATLERGQFVGERTLVTGKLRTADCIAKGRVRAVVIDKKDFMDLDNPLLSWMLDFDAVACAIRSVPMLAVLKQEGMEQVIECFNQRQELVQGDVLVKHGEPGSKMFVVKTGEVSLHNKGGEITDPDEIKAYVNEVGGFTYFGDACLKEIVASPYTVKVKSKTLSLLTLHRKNLDTLLGPAEGSLSLDMAELKLIVLALQESRMLKRTTTEHLKKLAKAFQKGGHFHTGQILVHQGDAANSMYVLSGGQCIVTSGVKGRPDSLSELACKGLKYAFMRPGDIFGEKGFLTCKTFPATLFAITEDVTVLELSAESLESALGLTREQLLQSITSRSSRRQRSVPLRRDIVFADIEQHRVIGTGQFGLVRICRHRRTQEVFALKVVHKATIDESKQIEHVINERRIMEEANHPFCVNLVASFQDNRSLYLLQEWVAGGEMFHRLDLEGSFKEPTAMFYAANVLLALAHLHDQGIIYRDLKPENLLINIDGYIKVADFGFAKKINNQRTYTICGTADYQAPEVIMRRGTNKSADYWALGVLIFEMLVGDPPFKSLSGDPWDTFRRALSGRFYVPTYISPVAADLIYKLLQVNPDRRLGSGPSGADDIKAHQWFAGVNWDALARRELPAPYVPTVGSPLDTSNFDSFDSADVPAPPNPHNDHHTWELWDWIEK